MNKIIKRFIFFTETWTSFKMMFLTMAICSFLYPLIVFLIGQMLVPYSAAGSLLRDNRGEIIGSELIAQSFSRDEYFWSRPSAVNYNAASTGGSNLSPNSPELRERAKVSIARFDASAEKLVPADLIATSGSGVDPNITLAAAKYQAERVAIARALPVEVVLELLDAHACCAGGAITTQPLVNVLLVNMALDSMEN